MEKIWFFGVKLWFFTRNIPKNFAPPSARRNFLRALPNLKYWIRPCKLYIILRDCTLFWQNVYYSDKLNYIIMTNCTLFWKTVHYYDKLYIILKNCILFWQTVHYSIWGHIIVVNGVGISKTSKYSYAKTLWKASSMGVSYWSCHHEPKLFFRCGMYKPLFRRRIK